MLLSQMYAITFAETATKEISDLKIQTILSHLPIGPKNNTHTEIRKIILKNLKIRSTEKFIRTLDQGKMKNLNERSQNHHRSNNSFIHLESKHD